MTATLKLERSTHLNPEQMDTLLAQELNLLSIYERSRIQEEIHGVDTMTPTETPELLRTSLQQLQIEIDRLPPSKKLAYQMALSMNSQYVHQTDVRLKFLRADLFDVEKAAERFCGYLDFTYEHFGKNVLMRPILQTDLTKVETDLLRRGNNQILPSRDRTGRLINVHQGAMLGKGVNCFERMRVMLYHFGAVSDDVETQKKGLVCIFSADKEAIEYFTTKEDQNANARFMATNPVRYSAMHMALPREPVFQLMQAMMILELFTKADRIRTRFYPGGLTLENQYQLMTYGIPIRGLPVTYSGSIKTKYYGLWLKNRNFLEKARQRNEASATEWIDIPGVNDVLFQMGGSRSHHYGNVEFEYIVQSKLGAYSGARDNKERKEIRNQVIDYVRSRGGRFLETNRTLEGRWLEITDVESLHDKLYGFFYHKQKTGEMVTGPQISSSDTDRFLEPPKRRKLNPGEGSCCWGNGA